MAKQDPEDIERLFAAARASRARAYAPYSGFPVGAAVLTENGQIHAGTNVENAAYPAGLCAEAGAIGAMVAAGETRIAAVMVVGGGHELVTPCGLCRQRIREFATPDTMVHVGDDAGVRRSFTFAELLPFAFGPANLGLSGDHHDE
jgi:cytidine deaminase